LSYNPQVPTLLYVPPPPLLPLPLLSFFVSKIS
jgi:hypothetical protein